MLYIIDSVGIVDSNVLKTALIGITYLSTNKLEVAILCYLTTPACMTICMYNLEVTDV